MDKGTVTKHFEAIIYLSPEETHRHFIKNLWWKLPWWLTIPVVSQISVIKPAKDEAGNGAIRSVPLGLHEEVLKAELGKYIEYHVSRKLWFPVTHHRGRVEFHAAGPNCTRMTWDINYTPKAHAFLILPGNWFMLELMIDDMVASANKGKNAKGSWLWFFVKLFLFAYLCFMVNRAMNLPSRPLHPGREYLAHTDRIREDTRLLNSVLAKNTYLIIGGSGFTGSALVDDLRKRGAKKIKIMGRSFPPAVEYPYGPTKQDRYPLPGVEYVKGDVTDMKALKEAMKGVDVVFHMAVYYGNPTFGVLRGKEQADKINVGGMKNIYNAAKESKSVSQIIYTSSVDTVFTHKPLEYVNETHPYAAYGDFTSTVAEGKWAIGDNYARTKIEAERFLLSMDNKDGIRTLSLRPDGIMGPGENIAFKRAVDIASILGILPFHFGPEIKHDITCVYNLVYAHVLATVKLATDPNVAGGKAYFITDDELTSMATYDVFKPAIEAAAGPVKLWFWVPPSIMPPIGYAQEVFDNFMTEKFGISVPPFLGYKEAMKVVMTHYFDNSRARKDLGYQPVITTGQCKLYIAEEIARRYGAVKE